VSEIFKSSSEFKENNIRKVSNIAKYGYLLKNWIQYDSIYLQNSYSEW